MNSHKGTNLYEMDTHLQDLSRSYIDIDIDIINANFQG